MNHRRVWICVFLFTLTLINYTDRVALSVAAKPISAEFGLSPVQMGYLLSSFLWMYVICLLPVGLLVDRFGGKVVNAAGIGLWSAATVLTGFTTGFVSMAGTRIVMGMGESTSWPACNRVIREWFPASERGLANAIFGAGAAAGPAIGAVLVSAVVAWLGWRAGFLVAGGIGFVWLAAWLIAFDKPERATWLRQAERDKILAERDGEIKAGVRGAGCVAAVAPADAAQRLGTVPDAGLRGLWRLHAADLAAELSADARKGLSVSECRHADRGAVRRRHRDGRCARAVSDKLLSRDAVHAGRRRSMLAVMLVSAASILLIPFIDSLWLIVRGARCRAFDGCGGQRAEFRAGDGPGAQPGGYRQGDQHHRAGRQFVRHDGADRHRLCRGSDRQLQRHVRRGRHAGADWRGGDADDDAAADRGFCGCRKHGSAGCLMMGDAALTHPTGRRGVNRVAWVSEASPTNPATIRAPAGSCRCAGCSPSAGAPRLPRAAGTGGR